MFTVKSKSNRNMNCNELGWYMLFMLILAMLTMVPLLIAGKASEFPFLIKYRDTVLQTCYGGNQLQDMSITPTIYNTTLTYYPAFLHLTTTTINRHGQLVPVRLTYPTYFQTKLACKCTEKGCIKKPCDKMVGDVITKYNELHTELMFPCYVYGNRVVGLAGEHTEIVKCYRLTLAGVCFGVLYAGWFLYLVCAKVCIKYIPVDDMLANKPKNHVQENTKTELSDSLILIRQDSSL